MRNRSLTPSRLDAWLASWRVALRWGAREARGHRGRSLLVLLLVGIPVTAIAMGLVLLNAVDPTMQQRTYGQAEASVRPNHGDMGFVTADAGHSMHIDHRRLDADTLLVAPGYSLDDPWTSERVAASIGQPVLPVAVGSVTQSQPQTSRPIRHLALDLQDMGAPVLTGMVGLDSGRWPQRADEVVVTPAGIAAGLPAEGTLTLGDTANLTVVGHGDAAWSDATNSDIIVASELGLPVDDSRWLVGQELDQTTVMAWPTYGLNVSVARPELLPLEWSTSSDLVMVGFVVAVGTGLTLQVMLMAGPAFAVNASRQRHSLAMAATQGAGPGQLRRVVLGYGLVLGSIAALVGAVVGTGLGALLVEWLQRRDPSTYLPVRLPTWPLGLLVLVAVLASVLAAWWPARGVGRLEVMSALRGTTVAGHVGRGWPVVGAVLVVVGIAIGASAASQWDGGTRIGLGIAVCVLGVLMLVPATLLGLARLTRGLPMPARMATRENVRQRSRSVPAVAAVVGAMLGATTFATALAYSDRASSLAYEPSAPVGTGTIHLGYHGMTAEESTQQVQEARQAIAAVQPHWEIHEVGSIRLAEDPQQSAGPVLADAIAFFPSRCSGADVGTTMYDDSVECPLRDTNLSSGSAVAVLPLELAEQWPRLGAEAVVPLAAGEMVAWDMSMSAAELGVDTLAVGTAPVDFTASTGEVTALASWQWESIPVHVIETGPVGWMTEVTGYAVVTIETAQVYGWQAYPTMLVVSDPAGPISAQDAEAVGVQLTPMGLSMQVESGSFDSTTLWGILIILAAMAVVALLGTIIGTALHLSETRADSATLAAVGANPRFRRWTAAWHAATLAGAGCLLALPTGMALGTITGRNSSLSTLQSGSSVSVDATGGDVVQHTLHWWSGLHWAPVAFAVLICLVAAGIGALMVRKTPTLTRRTV